MAWVKLDDQIPRNRKVLKAGPAASWLWVCGIAHCQSQLTDGFISDDVLPMIGVAKHTEARRLAEALVGVGLFDRVEGGYQVHDYLAHNPSRDIVLRKRAEDAARKAGKDSKAIPNGIHADSSAPRAGVPSHPIPSHPEKRDPRAPTDRNTQCDETTVPLLLDAFRAAWRRVYGFDCSVMEKPLEIMQLDQHVAKHGRERLQAAIAAYFAADDAYVRKAKHPLALWLRDPLKYLAGDAALPVGRPRGCKHEPACVDEAAHTTRDMADRSRA